MKRLVAILIFFSFLNFSAVEAQAEEVDLPIQSKELIYDMDKGGKQILEGLSPGGEKIIIEVEEIPNYFRSVKTGNYTISASMPGNWKASYRITVSNNKITRAYSPSILAYIGNFSSAALKLDSSVQSTYYMKRKLFLVTTSINLRAKLLSNRISITY